MTVARGRSIFYRLTNKSGGTVTNGMTVIVSTGNDLAFTTTTTSGDLRVIGVVADAEILDNEAGYIQLLGSITAEMETSAAVTRGHYVKQGTVAGKVITTGTAADATTAPPVGTIGIALTGTVGAGTIAVYIFDTRASASSGVTAFTGLSDVPASYVGKGLYGVRVNTGATALEFNYLSVVNVTDYGALGDDSTNDYVAINAALTALKAKGGGTLYFPWTAGGGKYRHGTGFILQTQANRKPIKILCDLGVQIRPTADIVVFDTKQDDSASFTDIVTTVLYENVFIKPVTTGHCTGFHINDSFGVKLQNCYIINSKIGVLVESTDSWSEGWNLDHVVMSNMTTGLEFRKTGGTGSFQSGRAHSLFIGTAAAGAGVGIKVGNGSRMFGSIFDINIWPGGNNSIGIDWDGNGDQVHMHGLVDLAGATGTPLYALRLGANSQDLDAWDFTVAFNGTFAGGEEESGAVKNATPITWTHSTLPYGSGSAVPTQGNFNGTTLDFDATVDGEYLRRSGTSIVTGTPPGTGSGGQAAFADGIKSYFPDLPPLVASATDDEFDDDAISGNWTTVGTPDTLTESTRHGFLNIADNDSVDTGVFKAYVPGANAFTVAFKVYGDVSAAGSNQALVGVYDSGGTNIVSMGMCNGNVWIYKAGAGAVTGNANYVAKNIGVFYGAITRDATTNYVLWVSEDGIIWTQIASFSQAGTVARCYLLVVGFAATATAWFDFVRMFTTQTTVIGRVPVQPYSPDNLPATPNAMDDEFDDTTGMSGTVNGLNARWAWRNQGTSTIAYANGVATITPPASASRNIRIIEQTQPAAQDYTIVAKLGITHTGGNFAQIALALIDGVNGDFYWFPIAVSASNALGTAVNLMTNVTTFSSTPLAGGAWHSQVAYFKIEYVNSTDTYTFSMSLDGISYYRLGSLVDAVGVTKVGVGIDEETNTGIPKLHIYWFRRIA